MDKMDGMTMNIEQARIGTRRKTSISRVIIWKF